MSGRFQTPIMQMWLQEYRIKSHSAYFTSASMHFDLQLTSGVRKKKQVDEQTNSQFNQSAQEPVRPQIITPEIKGRQKFKINLQVIN